MKSTSILAAVSIAVLAVACKKDEPATSETVTTGTTTTGESQLSIQKGKDAGVATDFRPTGGSDLIERVPVPVDQAPKTEISKKDPNNHSTPLGDGKSGSYTDGKGTHGGKATWGTGPHKDTKMDQPTPSTK